jgi:cysteine synthase B
MNMSPAQTKPGTSVAERIGNTPLVRLDQVVRSLEGITLLGKAEWANPGGSVKDRAAASMIADARDRGLLVPGKTLLDATSGNTGIAFAMLGAALGFPVHLAMPSNVSQERKRRADYPLCRRPGHQRHFHGRHPPPQGVQPRHPGHQLST